MKFTLRYDGELHSSNGNDYRTKVRRAPEIWAIRRVVSAQLALLWKRPPLSERSTLVSWFPREIKERRVVPLVVAEVKMLAALDIQILRGDEPGNIVNNAGDLDNRIKTLLDGLRGPLDSDKGDPPGNLPDPLYCLLEDDYLISELSIKTGPLLMPPLEPTPDPAAWVNVRIDVDVRAAELTMLNLGLASP